MVTRKTRWMSGLVAVLMLVSLFTAFTMPVYADGQTDLKAETGLADYTSLPNIADGYKSGTTAYQINSRAGFDKMKEIWDAANHTIQVYQTADIDMGWVPFAGISGNPNNKSWEGTSQLFDGNGFVIKNLLINAPDRSQVALFNRCWSGTTIKNVGIASGLIIGWNMVGSIAGVNCGGNIINCWSAATIITGAGNANQGTGGLVGQFWSRYGNSADMVNSYFIGTIISQGRYASGLIGRYAEDSTASAPRVFANNYFGGVMASAFTNSDMFAAETTDVTMPGYHVLFRGAADGQRADDAYNLKGGSPVAKGTTANNYYRENGSGLKSYADAVAAGVKLNGAATLDIDAATSVTEAQVGDGSLATKLNGGNLELGAVDGYTLGYVQTADGYPALGYYKDGTLAVCRTADAGHANVNAEDLAARGTVFNDVIMANRNGGLTAPLESITVSTANDLFAMGAFLFQSGISSVRTANVKLAADINCAECTFVPGCPWMMPIMATTFDIVMDGQNHVIYNWKAQGNVYANQPTVGLIQGANGATVKNLGMIDAYGEIEFGYASGDIWIYPALMIGQVGGTNTTRIENCFVTGHIQVTKDGSFIGSNSSNNAGAIVGRAMANAMTEGNQLEMKNCWSDVDRTFSWNNTTAEFRTLGSTANAYGAAGGATLDNVVYIAEETLIGSDDNTTDDHEVQPNVDKSTADGSMAAYLNDTTEGVYYTVKDGNTVFGTAENATHSITVNKTMENGTVNGTDVYYYNTGATVEIPVVSGYELDETTLPEGAGETSFTMPGENVTLTYVVQGVDYSGVEAIADELAQYDFDLFNESETLEQMQELVDATLAYKDQEQTAEVIAAANAAITNTINAYNALNISAMTLKDAYPYIPNYSDYEVYKNWNPANWGIATKEDWVAITQVNNNFSGKTIHLLANIDMENTNVQPLSYVANNFAGVLDGHGYVFENFSMEITMDTRPVGLVGRIVDSAVVKNVGIASGAIKFTYTQSGDGYGIGAIAGEANNGTKIVNCWNAASVTGAVASGGNANYSVSGIVGRGYDGSLIDGCFNVGTITGHAHAAGFNDWAQDTGKIYNSFNVGELKATSGNVLGMIRHNANTATNYHSNSYSLGYKFASGGHADRTAVLNAEPWTQMDTSIYTTGELAWMLNSGYTTGTKTYYTLKDGKTVFGTEDNQTIRVSLVCSGSATEYVYVNAGETVTLNYADNAEYALADGTAGTLNGTQFTAGKEDATINVTIVGFNYKNLTDAFDYYAARDVSLYAPYEEMDLAETIATLKTKMETDDFTAQAEIDAYASILMAFELIDEYPHLPAAKDADLYDGITAGYLIKDVADFEHVAANEYLFTAGMTLYLDADLDLTGSSFVGFQDLYANFDGKNHTISNLALNANSIGGMFRYYYGSKISNLTLDNVHTQGGYGRALLVGELYGNGGLTIENVHVKNSSVTATGNGVNAMGVLLSRTGGSGGDVIIKDCTITGTTMYTADSYTGDLGNTGFIIGQMHNGRNFNITNVVVSDCHMATRTTFATGIGFGCAEGACNVQMNNVAIINNKRTNSINNWGTRGILIGTVKGGSLLDLDNIILLNNDQTSANQFRVDSAADWNPAINMDTEDAVAMEGYSATNCFIDWKSFHNNNNQNTENGSKINVTSADYGYIAHVINATGVTMMWEVTAEGDLAVDTDGQGLPYAITFFAYDDDEATEDYQNVLYTNAEGKLIGLTQDILNVAEWENEATLADQVFTQNSTVIGVIPTVHEHVWGNPTHVDGSNTHVETCTVEGCEETQTVDCTFATVENVDAEAAPEAAAHITKCACGNATESVLCSADAENWAYEKVDSTCSVKGHITASCATCGYSYNEELALAEHVWGEWTHVEGTETHERTCANCDVEPETEACTFTGEWEEVTAPQVGVAGEERRACDKACGNYEYQDIDALPEPPADPIFKVELPEKAAPGETITVEVSINNNPGVAGVMIDVAYNTDALTMTGAAIGDFAGAVEFGETETGARVGYINAADVAEDGVFFVLTFAVAETANGIYTIDVAPVADNVVDQDNNAVEIGTAGGSVTVTTAIAGDVTADGRVSIADAVLLLRIASGDTELPENIDLAAGNVSAEGDTAEMPINTADVILLLQYLSGSVTTL